MPHMFRQIGELYSPTDFFEAPVYSKVPYGLTGEADFPPGTVHTLDLRFQRFCLARLSQTLLCIVSDFGKVRLSQRFKTFGLETLV